MICLLEENSFLKMEPVSKVKTHLKDSFNVNESPSALLFRRPISIHFPSRL